MTRRKIPEEEREKARVLRRVADEFGTPSYVSFEDVIRQNCRAAISMPNAFGITVRRAEKANARLAYMELTREEGLKRDGSSLNEVLKGVKFADIPLEDYLLTSQETPGPDTLHGLLHGGMKYNVCSRLQFLNTSMVQGIQDIPLSIRIHPGEGSGESVTRDTGSQYAPFGVHLNDLPEILRIAKDKGIIFDMVHTHIGSGANPEKWIKNIGKQLDIVKQFFPDATRVNFGGGIKVGRMPYETSADINLLGEYAKQEILRFYRETGRKLHMEIEPGTFIMANAGYIVTSVLDRKSTDKCEFVILDGGMEVNARPLLYAAKHPFYVIREDGELHSLDGYQSDMKKGKFSIVGRCCESGDGQTLGKGGKMISRWMAEPMIGDTVAIGGTGAYCSELSPNQYNSHLIPPEILVRSNGRFDLVRAKQTLEQQVQNERRLCP